jgi:hypothetical protein
MKFYFKFNKTFYFFNRPVFFVSIKNIGIKNTKHMLFIVFKYKLYLIFPIVRIFQITRKLVHNEMRYL